MNAKNIWFVNSRFYLHSNWIKKISSSRTALVQSNILYITIEVLENLPQNRYNLKKYVYIDL